VGAQANDREERRPSLGRGQVFLGTGTEPPVIPRASQLRGIYRLNDPALSELPLDPLLDALLIRIREILAVDTVAVLLLNKEGGELVARAAKGLEEEVERGVRIPVAKGFAGRIASERMPIFIADVDHADLMNPILREKGVRSMLGVPLIVEADLLGVMHVGTLQPRTFTNEDASVLQLAAARVAPAIQQANLFDALQREHRGAVLLQRSLLPDRLPEPLGVPVAARYLPASDEVGGDWYEVIDLPTGDVGIAIGDVAGHGVRAATLMGQLRTGLRAYALDADDPRSVLERLDRLLQSTRGPGMVMATAAYAIYDPETCKLRFSSSGHPPPAICSKNREPRLVETSPDPPLGVLGHPTHTQEELVLEDGDLFLFYTDGLVETRGESIDAGFARLLNAMRGASTPEQLCRQVLLHLVSRETVADDVAFVTLQCATVPDELLLRMPAEPGVLAQVRKILRRWLRTRVSSAEELDMITLACGEACANAIEHAFAPAPAVVEVEGRMEDGRVSLAVRDSGQWRAKREDGRARGMTIMEAGMDVEVTGTPNGTEVLLRQRRGE
jgi:serine phosphatase RsbU (regulator of sigma subunit)/anti-sigma regulatory factor (Ser/Thr protein kinase)